MHLFIFNKNQYLRKSIIIPILCKHFFKNKNNFLDACSHYKFSTRMELYEPKTREINNLSAYCLTKLYKHNMNKHRFMNTAAGNPIFSHISLSTTDYLTT